MGNCVKYSTVSTNNILNKWCCCCETCWVHGESVVISGVSSNRGWWRSVCRQIISNLGWGTTRRTVTSGAPTHTKTRIYIYIHTHTHTQHVGDGGSWWLHYWDRVCHQQSTSFRVTRACIDVDAILGCITTDSLFWRNFIPSVHILTVGKKQMY